MFNIKICYYSDKNGENAPWKKSEHDQTHNANAHSFIQVSFCNVLKQGKVSFLYYIFNEQWQNQTYSIYFNLTYLVLWKNSGCFHI